MDVNILTGLVALLLSVLVGLTVAVWREVRGLNGRLHRQEQWSLSVDEYHRTEKAAELRERDRLQRDWDKLERHVEHLREVAYQANKKFTQEGLEEWLTERRRRREEER